MKKLIFLLAFLSCGCSYHLYVIQISPQKEYKEPESINRDLITPREEQQTNPAIGDVTKAPNRNFTDVRNWGGNIFYLTIDSQTPKVVSTQASVPVTVTPIP
jgi:hypothetical protein